jgi:hypothetical protein
MIQYDKRLFLIQMESPLKRELVKINVFLQNLKKKEPNNSYKPITNTAWVRARLCKLQKGCTRLASASDKEIR